MDVNEKILQRLDELLADAEALSRTQTGFPFSVDAKRFTRWSLSCRRVAEQLAGRESGYYRTLEAHAVNCTSQHFIESRAALEALREDFAKGWLDIRELVAAEVFTDFLDMAQHLHGNRYHHPAASIAGAVLEDSLRRLHLKHIGQWQGDSSISKLNDSLRKADVYGQATWRQIQAWGDIRNDADHGHFEKVDAGQVKLMVYGIRDFVAKHEG